MFEALRPRDGKLTLGEPAENRTHASETYTAFRAAVFLWPPAPPLPFVEGAMVMSGMEMETHLECSRIRYTWYAIRIIDLNKQKREPGDFNLWYVCVFVPARENHHPQS